MTVTKKRHLAFVQLGDLHLTDARQQNYKDMLSIVAQIEAHFVRHLDFAVLPGDNADNGKPEQYDLAAIALRMLSLPVYAIPGDHDMEQGSLAAFHARLAPDPLPRSSIVHGHRLLFLDCCGNGSGGPDFRLGSGQIQWLETELAEATAQDETPVVFMHVYPADLKGEGEAQALTRLFVAHSVAFVAMGHTHYNEIAQDGATIYAATRSTGQIDEGAVGFSLTTIEQGVVSWRFKLLEDPFPFVMITMPADHRLMRDDDQALGETCPVRALVFGEEEVSLVECRVGDGAWTPMTRAADGHHWVATVRPSAAARATITVRATTPSGRPATHSITAAGPGSTRPVRAAQGSDTASIGAWPENGILGTQLGPNRNGRKW
ncbi:metallophosphoesterase [Acidisoma sp. 7E03]